MNFQPIDWIIVICYLAATMAAGLYGKRYVTGLGDFLVAGRKLGTQDEVGVLQRAEHPIPEAGGDPVVRHRVTEVVVEVVPAHETLVASRRPTQV